MFDLAALDAELAATIFAGKLHYAPTTASTNSDALAAARSGCAARLGVLERRATGRPRPWRSRLDFRRRRRPLRERSFAPAVSCRAFAVSSSRRGPGCRRCHSHGLRPRSRSSLAQRSVHRPAQDRRHPGRGRNLLQKSAPRSGGNRDQRASARVSAGPGHARHVARSGSEPAHRAPGLAARTAKIAAAGSSRVGESGRGK